MTGRTRRETSPAGGWPMLGSWVSKVLGPADATIPANLSLMYPTGNRTWGDPGTAGFISPAHAPMAIVAKDPLAPASSMTLQGITLERLGDRKQLLGSLDAFRRQLDQSQAVQSMDTFSQQAFSILSS